MHQYEKGPSVRGAFQARGASQWATSQTRENATPAGSCPETGQRIWSEVETLDCDAVKGFLLGQASHATPARETLELQPLRKVESSASVSAWVRGVTAHQPINH